MIRHNAAQTPSSPLTAMREWLLTGGIAAGILDPNVVFGAEHSQPNTSYSIGQGASSHAEDLLGNDMAVYNFTFTARLPYGPDPAQNLKASSLMHELCDWILTQNRACNFPEIPGYDATRMAATNPMMISIDAASALWQLQIRVECEHIVC